MDKTFILAEIRRTVEENGGRPLGASRFEKATGIAKSDWYGKLWARWGDAVVEAGFKPNEFTTSYDQDKLLEILIGVIRKLGKFPVAGELRLRAKQKPEFPSHTVFARLGRKHEVAAKLIEYCEGRRGYEDIIELCRPLAVRRSEPKALETSLDGGAESGYVYLLKFGGHFKLGRSNAHGRREYEIALQLPEKPEKVHVIATDDPVGIEAYWHNRFSDKRMNGEWFNLSAADVKAFKRRKFM